MKLHEISLDKFESVLSTPCCGSVVYNSSEFNRLNSAKVDEVRAFVLEDECRGIIGGQILGRRDKEWFAPFSAPFSCLETKENSDDTVVEEFYRLLNEHLSAPVKLVWPPAIYGAKKYPNRGKIIEDYNYHYPLQRYADYESYLSRAGRYNHHRALKHSFEFFKTDDIERAYSVIAANRMAMGYPLAMSLEQVRQTIKIVPSDFFLMTLEGNDIAAAMIYNCAPGIMQVIYWGDLPEGRPARAMNHLAWKVFGWYAENREDIDIVDIGPASSDGIRNEGLIQFKLSIGCVESIKPTIYLYP